MDEYSDPEDNNESVPTIIEEEVVQRKISEYQINEPFARLCHVMFTGAERVLRHVFNQIQPPLNLAERLTKPTLTTSLRRLKVQGLIR